jgi:hypothetical protein
MTQVPVITLIVDSKAWMMLVMEQAQADVATYLLVSDQRTG